MKSVAVNNFLAICALGQDRPGLLSELAQVIAETKCSIVDSRVTVMGEECGLLLLVDGNWNTLSKLEGRLPQVEQRLGLSLTAKRTDAHPVRNDAMPYAVEVIALDQAGIVQQLTQFFASRAINIEDFATRSYQAPHTAAAMFTINLIIAVPSTLHMGVLREEFMDFCDQFNWDAVLEPIKG